MKQDTLVRYNYPLKYQNSPRAMGDNYCNYPLKYQNKLPKSM